VTLQSSGWKDYNRPRDRKFQVGSWWMLLPRSRAAAPAELWSACHKARVCQLICGSVWCSSQQASAICDLWTRVVLRSARIRTWSFLQSDLGNATIWQHTIWQSDSHNATICEQKICKNLTHTIRQSVSKNSDNLTQSTHSLLMLS
jgi:hypothetical protein